jgi:hypothetical protein
MEARLIAHAHLDWPYLGQQWGKSIDCVVHEMSGVGSASTVSQNIA